MENTENQNNKIEKIARDIIMKQLDDHMMKQTGEIKNLRSVIDLLKRVNLRAFYKFFNRKFAV